MCWGRLKNSPICVWHGFGWNGYNLLAVIIEMLNGTFSVTVTRKSRIYEYAHFFFFTYPKCNCQTQEVFYLTVVCVHWKLQVSTSHLCLLNMGPQLLSKLSVMTFNCGKKKKKNPSVTGGGLSDLQSCVVSQSFFSPSVFSRCWAGSVMVSPCWMPAWWTPALCLRPSSCRGSMNSSRWL